MKAFISKFEVQCLCLPNLFAEYPLAPCARAHIGSSKHTTSLL